MKRQGETKCLVQRVLRNRTDQISGIQLEHAHTETGTDREVFTVADIRILVEITAANEELFIIAILGSDRNHDLFQQAVGRIGKRLQHTGKARP